MRNSLAARLLKLGGESLVANSPSLEDLNYLLLRGPIGHELSKLLLAKNGFFAWDGALLIRPLSRERAPLGLVQWNMPTRWRSAFQLDLDPYLFFAEDVFGIQVGFSDKGVFSFDPETAQLERRASSLEEWVGVLFQDPEVLTGYPLLDAWKRLRGSLAPGQRLLPKTPFVCGGQFAVENLYCMDEVDGMTFRAQIANQIKDLPDGSQIVLDLTHSGEPGAK